MLRHNYHILLLHTINKLTKAENTIKLSYKLITIKTTRKKERNQVIK